MLVGGSDWKRFTDDPMTFILKLPPEQLRALTKLVANPHINNARRQHRSRYRA
jgi:hypothetical protein